MLVYLGGSAGALKVEAQVIRTFCSIMFHSFQWALLFLDRNGVNVQHSTGHRWFLWADFAALLHTIAICGLQDFFFWLWAFLVPGVSFTCLDEVNKKEVRELEMMSCILGRVWWVWPSCLYALADKLVHLHADIFLIFWDNHQKGSLVWINWCFYYASTPSHKDFLEHYCC